MDISFLELDSFRNYERVRADFSPGANIITGKNAQGKTNLIEAAEYLASSRSFRTRRDADLIGFSRDEAYIKAGVNSRGREFIIEARIFRGRARRQLFVNGIRQKNMTEIQGMLNTVLFCPDDLYIIKEGAIYRRKFLDSAICKLRPKYGRALSEYNRLFEGKSRILKNDKLHPSLRDTLEDYSLGMCRAAAVIISHRAFYIDKLVKYAAGIYNEISNSAEELAIEYRTVSTVKNPALAAAQILPALIEHMNAHRKTEEEARSCLSGPHKDDFDLLLNRRSVRTYGSQGQIRSAALALKIAERDILCEDKGEYPIMLLDDVLSELDKTRSDYILRRIEKGQIIITCCREDLFGDLPGRILSVENGRITTAEF